MNKKQWFVIGSMFWFHGAIASHYQGAMYELLTWICTLTAIACWICGWLEKVGVEKALGDAR